MKESGTAGTYARRLYVHLAEYKAHRLGVPANGTYRGREYGHILPPSEKWLNLVDAYRDEIQEFLRRHPRIALHDCFHHLNSSQAFVLNLFVPFFEGGPASSRALLAALGQEAELLRWEPEAIPDPAEASNLDAVWDTADGTRTFCEVKLSERDFGKARSDERHLAKLKNIYLPRLAPYLSAELCSPAAFFASYQVLRNVWHMVGNPNGRLVFLMPRANGRLWPMIEVVRAGLSTEIAERVRCVAIEDVLEQVSTDARCPIALREYSARLRDKYVPAKR